MKRRLRKNNLFFYGLFLFGLSLFIFGCNDRKEEGGPYVNVGCIRKYPTEAPLIWKRICDKGPAISGTRVEEDVVEALWEAGFGCGGWIFPSAEEINKICNEETIIKED